MNDRRAIDLTTKMKNFINNFLEKPPPSSEHSKEIRSFLDVMEVAISKHSIWKDASEEELDIMNEGLEKYIISKIYPCVFSPDPEDLEKDKLLHSRIQQLSFITPEHLEISPKHTSNHLFSIAEKELQNIGKFKVPRDKLVCIMNACKIIYNILNQVNGSPAGADEFLPLLILIVLRANPPRLHSNIKFISRFRNPSKLMTETGYYFTQFESAVAFLETLDASSLKIDPEEFDRAMKLHCPSSSKVSLETKTPEQSRCSRFLNANPSDLTVEQLFSLMDDYKYLIAENQAFRAQLIK